MVGRSGVGISSVKQHHTPTMDPNLLVDDKVNIDPQFGDMTVVSFEHDGGVLGGLEILNDLPEILQVINITILKYGADESFSQKAHFVPYYSGRCSWQ